MSQEEAIEIINRNCTEGSQLREACAMFIPELKESEDERIREIIRLALIASEDELSDFYKVHNISRKECTDWLEKQKEPIDPFDTKLFQDGVKEGRRLEREDIKKEPIPIPDKFSGLKSLLLQYLQSAANRKDDTEIESDTDLWGRKILNYVWKYSEKQKEFVSEDFEVIWEPEDCKTLLDEGGKLSPRFKEMFKEVCHSWYDKGIEVGEKQKEQKPASSGSSEKPNNLLWSEGDEGVCKKQKEQPQVADASKMEQSGGYLEYWLEQFGMPKENIENCADQIAQGYGAFRYLEGVQDGTEAVNELGKQEKGYYGAYLDECIAKARKTWEGVDADKYMDEVRGREQVQPEVELEKASRNVYESWKGGTMDDFLRDMVELGKALNASKED